LPEDLKDLKKKLPKSKYSSSVDEDIYQDKYHSENFIKDEQKNIDKFLHIDHYLKLAKKKK
jgi:hypothetical protein